MVTVETNQLIDNGIAGTLTQTQFVILYKLSDSQLASFECQFVVTILEQFDLSIFHDSNRFSSEAIHMWFHLMHTQIGHDHFGGMNGIMIRVGKYLNHLCRIQIEFDFADFADIILIGQFSMNRPGRGVERVDLRLSDILNTLCAFRQLKLRRIAIRSLLAEILMSLLLDPRSAHRITLFQFQGRRQ